MKAKLALLLALSFPAFAQSPHAILLVAAQGGAATGATLKWAASPTAGTTVNVYRCSGVGCTLFMKLATGQPAAGPYVDTTVTSGAYSYYVTAVGPGGESAPSNTAVYTLAPLPPTGLTAQ